MRDMAGVNSKRILQAEIRLLGFFSRGGVEEDKKGLDAVGETSQEDTMAF